MTIAEIQELFKKIDSIKENISEIKEDISAIKATCKGREKSCTQVQEIKLKVAELYKIGKGKEKFLYLIIGSIVTIVLSRLLG